MKDPVHVEVTPSKSESESSIRTDDEMIRRLAYELWQPRGGVEPSRVHLGALQTPRTAQRLRQEPLGSERRRPPLPEADAPPAAAHHRFLETGFFIPLIPLYYAGFNRHARRS